MAQLVEWSLDEPRDPQLESYSIFEIFLSIVTQAVLQNCFLLIMFQSQIYEEAGNVALHKQCKFSHIRIGWILQSIILNMIATFGCNHYIYVTLFQGIEYDDFKIFHLAAIPAQRPNAPPKNSSLTVSGCISSAILHDYRQNLILNCTKYVRQSVCQKLTIITNLLIF